MPDRSSRKNRTGSRADIGFAVARIGADDLHVTTSHQLINEQMYSAIPLATSIVKPLFAGTSKYSPAW